MAEEKAKDKPVASPKGHNWKLVTNPGKYQHLACGICENLAIDPYTLTCPIHLEEDPDFDSDIYCKGKAPYTLYYRLPFQRDSHILKLQLASAIILNRMTESALKAAIPTPS